MERKRAGKRRDLVFSYRQRRKHLAHAHHVHTHTHIFSHILVREHILYSPHLDLAYDFEGIVSLKEHID